MNEGKHKISSPLVSVLLPIYNAEKYIIEAIQSICDQTYPRLEIIIVDDGSTDSSLKLVSDFAAKSIKTIKILQQRNKGVCNARNKAFRYSSGTWIQYMDADDIVSAEKIDEQLKIALTEPETTIINCSWSKFSNKIEDAINEKRSIEKDYSKIENFLYDSWTKHEFSLVSTWLTHRSIIEKVGPWDETLKINDDGEFFCRVLSACEKIRYSPKGKVFYRRDNPNSVSSNMFIPEKAMSLLNSYILYKQCVSKRFKGKAINNALNHLFITYHFQFFDQHPKLAKSSLGQIKSYKWRKFYNRYGGGLFKLFRFFFGLKNALYFEAKYRAFKRT